MTDHGDNIVVLAREILKAGLPENQASARKMGITMSFKTLCLTTMLAAAGGGAVTAWTHGADRPLNRYEKVEIDALVFYAARVKGLDEATLRHDVAEKVGAARFEDMGASDFAAARRYLQEAAQQDK